LSATENKKLIQQAFAKWAGGDADAVFKLLADDVQWTVIGSTPECRACAMGSSIRFIR
jgi:ketosteroid isomerase-like protein